MDDFLQYLRGIANDTQAALIMRKPNGSPNAGEDLAWGITSETSCVDRALTGHYAGNVGGPVRRVRSSSAFTRSRIGQTHTNKETRSRMVDFNGRMYNLVVNRQLVPYFRGR